MSAVGSRLLLPGRIKPAGASWAPFGAGALLAVWLPIWVAVAAAIVGGEKSGPTTEEGCAYGCGSSCSDREASAQEAVARAMPELIEGVNGVATAVDELRGGIELATVHRRVSDLELLVAGWLGTKGGQCVAPAPEAVSDTVGPCVKRKRVGEIRFAPDSIEPRQCQETEISRIAKTVGDGLRFVFVVGNADDGEVSAQNRELGLQRAESAARVLREELGSTPGEGSEHGTTNAPRINVASGMDWVPAPSESRSSEYGKANVYVVWHGSSPLCESGRPVSLM